MRLGFKVPRFTRTRWWLSGSAERLGLFRLADWLEPEPKVNILEVLEGVAAFAALATVVRHSETFAKLIGGLSDDTRKALDFALGLTTSDGDQAVAPESRVP